MSTLASSSDEESKFLFRNEKTLEGFFSFTARPPWIKSVFLPDTPVRFYEFSSQESLIDVNIKVNCVTSPVHFYWTLAKSRSALKQLTKKMGDLYDNNFGKYYTLDDDQIYVGQLLAVKFHNKHWHRARITGIPSVPFIDVAYVDYGTESRVHIKNVRHLHLDFTTFPIQGMRGYLMGVEPVSSSSSSKSSSSMSSLSPPQSQSQSQSASTTNYDFSLLGINFLQSLVVGKKKFITATIQQVDTIVKRDGSVPPFLTKEYGMLLVDRSQTKEGIDIIQKCMSSGVVRFPHSTFPTTR